VDDQVDEVGASEAVASVLTPLEAFQLLGLEDFDRIIAVRELTDITAGVMVVRGWGWLPASRIDSLIVYYFNKCGFI